MTFLLQLEDRMLKRLGSLTLTLVAFGVSDNGDAATKPVPTFGMKRPENSPTGH